ncbi:RING finger protein 220b [Plakobranchus ocellatus]|uniref:RING finger protein 220b n=1 Tax=Plakobranchus ocellatus TaxID=259542 RepID=A0AAV3ZRD3_9GAST|nr:RING finger protein 220b [Plakobranchus ocellatus]
MKTILTNKHISIKTRKRALQCYIEPVLMYGCEAWTISKQIQNKLEATEMWFLKRMLWIPWTANKTNERVLNEANKRRSLVRTIRKRQATFLGHMMRRGKLEHLVTTGKNSTQSTPALISALRLKLQDLEAEKAQKQKCLICMEPYKTPLTSIQCWHVHCENCWMRTLGAKKLCPQCNMITSPTDLRRIYL